MAFIEQVRGLSLQKKLIAGGAVVGVIALLMTLARVASKPPMSLLYAGVDQVAAGEIVQRLDAEGITYSVEGERIYVEAPARDRLRLTLAQAGLPRQSVVGYELLDDLSGFSTTSDMFSAAYWRAKEGELTRTLLTMPRIRAARVHIGADERSPFSRQQSVRTASVTVTAPAGLQTTQIKAIQHMTALAVSAMNPDDVAVIDTQHGLLSASGEAEGAGALLDEQKRSAALESALLRLVEARVGQGNARINVSMDLTRQREAISEQIVDPQGSVVLSRTRTESNMTEEGRDAAVTVASDLPDGEAEGAESSTERTEVREDVQYAVSTMDRTVERLPGQISRLNVAVLIDHLPAEEEGGETAPRPAEEIAALRQLIEAAAGINADRGDRLTIQTLPFERPTLEEAASPSPVASGLTAIEPRLWQVGQLVFLGLVTLALGMFVVKPIMTQGGAEPAAAQALAASSGTLIEDPVTMLRQSAADAPDDAAAILNAWLEEEEAA